MRQPDDEFNPPAVIIPAIFILFFEELT